MLLILALTLFVIIRIGSVGAGLLYTIDDQTSTRAIIGYQILFGVGVGPSMQGYTVALMADVPSRRMIAQAMAIATFFQRIGGTIALSMYSALYPVLPTLIILTGMQYRRYLQQRAQGKAARVRARG